MKHSREVGRGFGCVPVRGCAGEEEEMKVLILTVSAGFGHISVSKALQAYIEKKGDAARTVDVLEYINPTLNRIFRSYYIRSLRYIPEDIQSKVYEKEIRETLREAEKNEEEKKESLLETVKSFGEEITLAEIFAKLIAGDKIRELIEEFQPDSIISTHPFIGDMMDGIYREEELSFSLLTIITDYVVHPSWFNQTSDLFILPSELLKYDLQTLHIDESKVRYLGIPVREKFDKISRKKEEAGRFTYLIMGGGYGLGKLKHYVQQLLSLEQDADILVLCGKNEELREELLRLREERGYPNLYPHGFTEEVDVLMAAADVLISKPGGVTLTETMQMGLPILIKDFLPGQEQRNVQFILNNHLGVYAATDMEFLSCCRRLFEDAKFRRQLGKNMEEIRKKGTAAAIYELLVSLRKGERGCD